MMILTGIYILFINNLYGEANIVIRRSFGVFPVVGITVWIIFMFEDLLSSHGREMLLSLPYDHMKYGVVRVVKFSIIYILIFYIFLAILIILFNKNYNFELQDLYLPVISIFFYSAFSFFISIIVKNIIASFAVCGIFSVFMYSTRGGVSLMIYPFQWSNPNPYYSPCIVAVVLMCITVLLFVVDDILFRNREFLLK